jgi:hypothetical protein
MKRLTLLLPLITLCGLAFSQATAPIRPESKYLIIPVSQVQPPWGCDTIEKMVRVGDHSTAFIRCGGVNGSEPDASIYIRAGLVKWSGPNPDWKGGKK